MQDYNVAMMNRVKLGIDRWLQVLAVASKEQDICVISCGTALTIDLTHGLNHLGVAISCQIYVYNVIP